MPDFALMLFAMAAAMFYCARTEYVNENPRDARLLAAFGVGGLMAGATVMLL